MVFVSKSVIDKKVLYYNGNNHEKQSLFNMLGGPVIVVSAKDSEKSTLFVKNCLASDFSQLTTEVSAVLRHHLGSNCPTFSYYSLKDFRECHNQTTLRKSGKLTSIACESPDRSVWLELKQSMRKGEIQIIHTETGPRLFIALEPPTSSVVFSLNVPRVTQPTRAIDVPGPTDESIGEQGVSIVVECPSPPPHSSQNEARSHHQSFDTTLETPSSNPTQFSSVSHVVSAPTSPIPIAASPTIPSSVKNLSEKLHCKDIFDDQNAHLLKRPICDIQTPTPPPYFAKKSKPTTISDPEITPKKNVEKESYEVNQFLRTIQLPSPKQSREQRGVKFSGREVVRNVKKNLDILKQCLGDVSKNTLFANTTRLTAALTGLSESTITRSKNRFNDVYRKVKSRAERRKRAGERVPKDDKNLLRLHLEERWKKQEPVTLDYLVEWCEKYWETPLKKTALCDVLHSMGLSYKKKTGNPLIEERFDLIYRRSKYLKRKWELLNPADGIEAYMGFLDETWCFAGMVSEYGWQQKDNNMYHHCRLGNLNEPIPGPVKGKNKGKRGIVLSVLTLDGILDDSIEIIVSGVKESDQSEDYHQEMNADNYRKYLEKVVPELAKAALFNGMRAVLIIDNAPYHNKLISSAPRQNATMPVIREFLQRHNVQFDPKLRKTPLKKVFLDFLAQNGGRRAFDVYEMDEWAMKEHGVEILRLPPYHCIFNPIELLWAGLKAHLKKWGKTTDKIQEVRARAMEWLKNYTKEEAQKLIFHVEGIEEEIRQKM